MRPNEQLVPVDWNHKSFCCMFHVTLIFFFYCKDEALSPPPPAGAGWDVTGREAEVVAGGRGGGGGDHSASLQEQSRRHSSLQHHRLRTSCACVLKRAHTWAFVWAPGVDSAATVTCIIVTMAMGSRGGGNHKENGGRLKWSFARVSTWTQWNFLPFISPLVACVTRLPPFQPLKFILSMRYLMTFLTTAA